jgi:hypothetical protein
LKKGHLLLAYLLLLVFSWASLPTHTIHDLFADHEDTEHGFCERYHAHLGTHVEKKHQHCDILKFNAPAYEPPSFLSLQKAERIIFASLFTSYSEAAKDQNLFLFPARGPPTV